MANSINKRNGKIDFMKFIFALIVVLHHGRNIGDGSILFAKGGSFAVEFFFIVSGYLMMVTVAKNNNTDYTKLGLETRTFIFRKVKSLFPEVLVTYIVAFIVNQFLYGGAIIDNFRKSSHSLMLWNMFGLNYMDITGASWYISSMLISMTILYPLVRRYRDLMLNIVCPFLILFIFGSFCVNATSPRGPSDWFIFTYKGNLRAFAELSIGACIYPVVENIKQIGYNLNKIGKILLNIVEWGGYIIVITYMQKNSSRQDYFYIIILALAITISFSHICLDSELFDNKVNYFLGKYSLSLYLCHKITLMGDLKTYLYERLPSNLQIKVYLLVSIALGLVVMFMAEQIRRLTPKIIKRLKKNLYITTIETNERE